MVCLQSLNRQVSARTAWQVSGSEGVQVSCISVSLSQSLTESIKTNAEKTHHSTAQCEQWPEHNSAAADGDVRLSQEGDGIGQ
jgi:hypothetical protein